MAKRSVFCRAFALFWAAAFSLVLWGGFPAAAQTLLPAQGEENVWEVRENRDGPVIYTISPTGDSSGGEGALAVTKDGETEEYRYEFSGDREDYRCEIRFPDGTGWYWNQNADGFGSGGGSWYDTHMLSSPYPDPDILCEVIVELEAAPAGGGIGGRLIPAMILAALGLFELLKPRTAWYLSYGWRYKNAEPSDIALGVGRASGVVILICAAVLLFS